MKKLGILIVFFFVMAAFTTAHAEIREGAFSLGLSAGGYLFENNQDYKNNVAIGVRAGYNFNANFGSELFIHYVPSKYEDDKADKHNRVYVAGLEGLYHFTPENRFVPYLAVGIGAIHYTSDDSDLVPSKLTVDYGAGFKYFMRDNLAFRADIRHVLPLGDKSDYGDNPHFIHNDLMVTFGLGYYFGGEKEKAIVPAATVEKPVRKEVEVVGDADHDGVPDNVDQCPGTSSGVKVDKIGCLPDTDKDGVADTLDKCPETPAGETVEQDGCVRTSYSIALKVEFDTGKSEIKKQYYEELKTTAVFMKKHPEATATIVGHTDNVGDPQKNMLLSEERAGSVRQYLIDEFGIDGSRITAIGNGAEKPVAGNDTEEGRQKNRRIIAIFQTILKK